MFGNWLKGIRDGTYAWKLQEKGNRLSLEISGWRLSVRSFLFGVILGIARLAIAMEVVSL